MLALQKGMPFFQFLKVLDCIDIDRTKFSDILFQTCNLLFDLTALDDSNVTRFAQYLHKLTKNTQFIIITHRRGTMNAADRLYGITMQEKGVSTLVSVNLIENELDK